MALDNRSIVITLKLDQGDSKVEENPTDTNGAQKSSDKDGSKKAITAYIAAQVSKMIANEVIDWAEYFWNKELTLNDDYVGQRNKRIALTQISRATNVVTTVGSMASSGAAIGRGWGALAGAIVGVVVSAVNSVRSNVQGWDQQQLQLRQLDAGLKFTRSRAGWSLQAASIGEDL